MGWDIWWRKTFMSSDSIGIIISIESRGNLPGWEMSISK